MLKCMTFDRMHEHSEVAAFAYQYRIGNKCLKLSENHGTKHKCI